jgi:hypothetical protein
MATYTAEPNTPSEDKLKMLASWVATESADAPGKTATEA